MWFYFSILLGISISDPQSALEIGGKDSTMRTRLRLVCVKRCSDIQWWSCQSVLPKKNRTTLWWTNHSALARISLYMRLSEGHFPFFSFSGWWILHTSPRPIAETHISAWWMTSRLQHIPPERHERHDDRQASHFAYKALCQVRRKQQILRGETPSHWVDWVEGIDLCRWWGERYEHILIWTQIGILIWTQWTH